MIPVHTPHHLHSVSTVAPTVYYLVSSVFYVVSIAAVVASYFSFRRNNRVRHSQWLSSLHQQFYQSTNYKRLRRIIDYDTTELKTIELAIEADCAHELVESLVDYLNFFEFVAGLWENDELTTGEVSMLFQYYLTLLNERKFLAKYIADESFERLEKLLKEFPAKGNSKPKARGYYLFVYGTLRKLTSRQTHRLLLPSAFIGKGFFTGKLYDVGSYPGAVGGSDPSEMVTGEVYLLHDRDLVLQKLDQYEGCGDAEPEPKEYKRELVEIQLQTGDSVEAWIYLYNHDTANLKLIESGDYKKYLGGKKVQ